MIKDEDGISKIIEFIMAFVVFLLILASFFNAIDNRFTPQEREDSKLLNNAITISNLLVGDPGLLYDSENGTNDWENFPTKGDSFNIYDNITRIGLASEKQGILNYNKIQGIGNISYTQLKELFGLDLYDFNITIYSLTNNKEPITVFGLDYEKSERLTMVTRIVTILFENGTYMEAKMETRVFLYGRTSERVIITEFMYNPESGSHKDEWIEIYNPTFMAIDVTNWSIGSSKQKSRIIGYDDYFGNKGAIIPSKGYAVIAPSTEKVKTSYNNVDTIWLGLEDTEKFGSTGLSDIGSEIVIEKYGNVLDTLNYDSSTWGVNGQSLQKINIFGNNSVENWETNENETPGTVNFI